MTLSAGASIGRYQIVAVLGAGGMGEVYRAVDTQLHRDVAIKILPEAFVEDDTRIARFQREAQVLASLNHPNIAQIYGVEPLPVTRAGRPLSAIVLELVEGPTLGDYIDREPIPVMETLRIARQLADALEAAHERGIVHRDLKPANIKVRDDGTVKVLDFGLAKPVEANTRVDPTASPLSNTITSPVISIHAGVLLGTAAYMSPEQAKGKPVDRGSDMWAFGCVLYEMLARKRAFVGDDVSETIAEIVKGSPDWSALPPLPASIERLLRRCLARDRRLRLADAAAARLEIEEAISSHAVPATGPSHERAARRRLLPWLLTAASLAAAIVMLVLWSPWSAPSLAGAVRLSTDVGTALSLTSLPGPALALSRDGAALAFVAQPAAGGAASQLYYRRLDQLAAHPIAGTSGAMNPFFSPDGRWIGFFADTKLKKISVTGGAPVAIADAPNGRGGSWGEDQFIVYTPDLSSGVWRVSAFGGAPTRVSAVGAGEATHRWPQILPGGRAVLYTSNGSFLGYEDAVSVVQPLPDGPRKIVHRGGYHGQYVASGHLVYVHNGTLFAVPFDSDRLEVTGGAVSIMEGISGSPFWTGSAQIAVADNGTIAYGPAGSDATPLHWLDADGATSTLYSTPTSWSDPSFSPDGRRVAFEVFDGKQLDIWMYEWDRDALTRVTFDSGDDAKPVWSPDGQWMSFGSTRGGGRVFDIYVQRVDGSGSAQRLTHGFNGWPASWHPTNKFLTCWRIQPTTSFDAMVLSLSGDTSAGWKPETLRPLLNSPATEIEATFSPDGRWIAYFSNASGRFEVYVIPFDRPGGPWQVSNGGGLWPTWSHSRSELFFSTPDQRLMTASYRTEGDSFVAAPPRQWSKLRLKPRGPLGNRSFNLHPDGRRVMLTVASDSAAENKLVFVFNFFDEIRRLSRRDAMNLAFRLLTF